MLSRIEHEPKGFSYFRSMILGAHNIAFLVVSVGTVALLLFYLALMAPGFVLIPWTAALATSGAWFFLMAYFFPFSQGDHQLSRLFGRKDGGFVVQVGFRPRRLGGLRGAWDDADDFGTLRLEGDYVIFEGQTWKIEAHRADFIAVRLEGAGAGAMGMLGPAVGFYFQEPVEGSSGFVVMLREGFTLPRARQRNREFIRHLVEGRLLPPCREAGM